MNSGLFRMDASQVLSDVRLVLSYWGVDPEVTKKDKQVAGASLALAAHQARQLARRWQVESLVDAQAQDLTPGDRVLLTVDDQEWEMEFVSYDFGKDGDVFDVFFKHGPFPWVLKNVPRQRLYRVIVEED